MANWSVVTHSSTHLTGIQRPSSTVGITHYGPADIAAINALILNDQNPTQHLWQTYAANGVIVIPNRGVLQLKAGDFVCFDSTTGWPIVISGDAAANGPYTHS